MWRRTFAVVEQGYIEPATLIKLTKDARRCLPEVLHATVANTITSVVVASGRWFLMRAWGATTRLGTRHSDLLPKSFFATLLLAIFFIVFVSVIYISIVRIVQVVVLLRGRWQALWILISSPCSVFVLILHETAHEVQTEAQNGENCTKDCDHLPSVRMRLRQESCVDGLGVLAWLE